jgi:hypothetical protein
LPTPGGTAVSGEVDLAQETLSIGSLEPPACMVVGGSFEVGDLALSVLERCMWGLPLGSG